MQAMHGGDVYRNEIELDFSVNLNPKGISEKVKTSINNSIQFLDRYPDPVNEKLCAALALKYGLKPNQIVCGNGASEILMSIVHGLKPKKVLIPIPTFSGYERATMVSGALVKFYHLKEESEFALDEEFLNELDNDYDMVFVANPANPTGNLVEDELLYQIMDKCEAMGTWFVLDNCFIDFVDDRDNVAELLGKYKKLIILKAFTKFYGMPGVRLGYAMGSDMRMLMNLKIHLPEWNISVLAQNAGVAALEDWDYYKDTKEIVAAERAYLVDALKKVFADNAKEIKVYDGKANFILIKTNVKLYDLLLKKKILIRNCSNYRGLGRGYFRIAVKSHEDNERLIKAVGEVINE